MSGKNKEYNEIIFQLFELLRRDGYFFTSKGLSNSRIIKTLKQINKYIGKNEIDEIVYKLQRNYTEYLFNWILSEFPHIFDKDDYSPLKIGTYYLLDLKLFYLIMNEIKRNYPLKNNFKVKFRKKTIKPEPYRSVPPDTDEYLLKLVALGSEKKKSELIRKFAEDKFTRNYLPTLGVDITTKKVEVDNKTVKLILVDTAGQEFFGKLRPNYYKGASGALIFFNRSDILSFEKSKSLVSEFSENVLTPCFSLVSFCGNNHEIDDDVCENFAEEINGRYYKLPKGDQGEYKGITDAVMNITSCIIAEKS